jgi:cytochrome c553
MSVICNESSDFTDAVPVRQIARELEIMKRIGLKTALVAIVASIAPAAAWDEAGSVRNCTWCHGTTGQGYMVAPRLAGQRPAYIESQIRSFRDHTRDNPFSKQYMWSAVAALDARTARDLATYFATILPKPANDGDPNLAAIGRAIYMDGIPEANVASCYACHGPNRRACGISPGSGARLFLPEGAARAVGPGISFGHGHANAHRCAPVGPQGNRGVSFLPKRLASALRHEPENICSV